jgi:hypothetical protein
LVSAFEARPAQAGLFLLRRDGISLRTLRLLFASFAAKALNRKERKGRKENLIVRPPHSILFG